MEKIKLAEILEILESNVNLKNINRARKHDERMAFYSDRMYDENSNSYATSFFEKIENKLQNTKSINSFKINVDFPLEINNFTEEIRAKLSEIWNGQNRIFTANFKKEGNNTQFNLDFYKNELFDKYFKSPNTLVYLEYLETEINYKFIPISQIIEYSYESKNVFEYVIFSANDSIYFVDKNSIIQLKSATNNLTDYSSLKIVSIILLNEKLNICPIFHISNEIYNNESDFVRTNILSNSMSYLDLLQEVFIYKKMLTPFAFNLIIEKYRNPECNYSNGDNYCQNGYMYLTTDSESPQAIHGEKGQLLPCPICNQTISPGMSIEKSTTFSLKNTDNTISDVIKFISPETDILIYSDEFIVKLKEQILNSIIGKTKDNIGKQNSNELSVLSSNTEKLQVILTLKSKFESVILNIENARAGWLFGDNFSFWNINLGTVFLLKDLSELYLELENAKTSNSQEMKNIKKQIIHTKYANDVIQKSKELILLDFIPSTNFENTDVISHLKLKQLFAIDFITDFELKHGNIGNLNTSKKEIISRLNNEFIKFLEKNVEN